MTSAAPGRSGAGIGVRALAAFGLACLASLPACEPRAAGDPPGAVELPAPDPSRFDGGRAFADLRALVALGPRPPGSEASAAARRLIAERLRQAGFRVEEQAVDGRRPDGRAVRFTNVIGTRRGRQPDLILFVTHYDTKALEGIRFVGANDGASGAALLLELARQVAAAGHDHTVWLAFCDGEEAFGPGITRQDGLYGSRALAARMQSEGTLARVRALILVDMVADVDLNLGGSREDSPSLRRELGRAAESLGLADVLDPHLLPGLVDDHTPFAELGLEEILTLIDFQYGDRRTPGPWWHTERDDLAGVSERSLNSAGALTVEVFRRIDREPDRVGRPLGP